MNCMEREQLFAYVHRMLEGREGEDVRGHLEQCARCRTSVEELRKLDAVLAEWKPQEPSPWFEARVRAAVSAAQKEKTARPFFAQPWARLWVPALALVVILIAALAMLRTPSSEQAPQPVAQKEQPQPAQPAATDSPESLPETLAQSNATAPSVEDELTLYQNLGLLEDYELLADFAVLSELPTGEKQVAN
jgi:anti-sigma factor RsiW